MMENIWKWIEPVQENALPEPPSGGFGAPLPENYELENVKRLRPAQYLRKSFILNTAASPLRTAKLAATSHGLYLIWLNGERPDDRVMSPEVTAFDKELTYQEYDVTALLRDGENVIGAVLTDGWHIGRIGLVGASCQYTDRLAFLCQLTLTYEDGSEEVISSDDSWTSATGPLEYSDIFIGERYHAGKEVPGWNLPGFCEETSTNHLGEPVTWQPVTVAAVSGSAADNTKGCRDYSEHLVPQTIAPVRKKEHFTGTPLITPEGDLVYDFGQNIAGVESITVTAPAGTILKLEHGEVLTKEGNFIRNIGGSNKNQTDFYVCRGTSADGETVVPETYEPTGTWHGFRYLKVSAWLPGGLLDERTGEPVFAAPDPAQITIYHTDAWAIRTDNPETASFSCSDERLNKLWQNILWSLRGNTISIPTDCPQRERSGFTGDMQVIINTACWMMDMREFAASWLRTVRLEQNALGEVTIIAPNFPALEAMQRGMPGGANTSCGWGDAIAIVPWKLYQFYGDRRFLTDNYESMKKWLHFINRWAWTGEYPVMTEALRQSLLDPDFDLLEDDTAWLANPREDHKRYLWDTGFSFGDWLVPSRSRGMSNPFATAEETKEPIGTAYYAHTADLVAQAAEELGHEGEAGAYRFLATQIREAYKLEYYKGNGNINDSKLQGIYVTALAYHMLPEEEAALCMETLAGLIEEQGDCLDTGFLSVEPLMDVLCDHGCTDLALKLLYQTKCPSWLYEVEQGATTMWESWSAILPDGTVTNSSYNHYAFGCVADWMMRKLAGIRSMAPGFSQLEIAPLFDCGLDQVEASYESVRGLIHVKWEKAENGEITITVQIPEGVEAVLVCGAERYPLESGLSRRVVHKTK